MRAFLASLACPLYLPRNYFPAPPTISSQSWFRLRSWLILPLLTVLALPLSFADASDDGNVEKQATSSQGTTPVSEVTQRDLDVLKETGWNRSRYRLQTENAASSIEIPEPKLLEFAEQIQPILRDNCVDCHGESIQEGNVRIDSLDPNLHTGNDVDWWNEIFAVISKGEMPPPEAGELADSDRQLLVEWLSSELQTASIVRRGTSKQTAFRRLTRYEFNYALQDLLGLPWNFAKDLPPEPISADGFQNSSDLLQMSVTQFETYQRLARSALLRATVRGDKPVPIRWGISMKDNAELDWSKIDQQIKEVSDAHKDNPEKLAEELEKLELGFQQAPNKTYYHDLQSGRKVAASWSYPGAKHANPPSTTPVSPAADSTCVAIIPAGQWLNIELGNHIPDEGILRVRVRACRGQPETASVPSLQLQFGWQASNEGRALMRVSDQEWTITASPEAPEFYEWNVPLGEIYPRNSVRKNSPMGAMPNPSEYIRLVNTSASPATIQVDFVEVLAPVYTQWPPESHKQIFFPSPHDKDDLLYAREIITDFLKRAWRRPATPEEIDKKVALFVNIEPHSESFEEAIIETLASALASPNFLFVVQEDFVPQSSSASNSRPLLSPHELATRLSLFLWCSVPDSQLLELADSGRLCDTDVLDAQVARMLADPRSKRFSELFVSQWLDLERLEFINFRKHVRGFDPLLQEAMFHEPIALFEEILEKNESVLNFLHANYAMVNERLARHYGIPHIYGNHFRRVPLDGSPRRGGLLTAAGPLAMNSDYPDSHPLKRGKWLLECLLNDPPPPPPPAVPQIDLANPEIAKMTLKERIEDHRNHPACISCHIKIDPWGIAFENYDALGKWRDQVQNKPVDASSELFNHETLDGIVGLKRFLLEGRQDQFVQAMVFKMTTFALGRPLSFADQADIEMITANVRRQGDGLATLVKVIVDSELFRSK